MLAEPLTRSASPPNRPAWLTALNDLRLVLGTRLEVSEDSLLGDLPEDDPRAPDLALYAYLSWLQEQVIEAMAGELG